MKQLMKCILPLIVASQMISINSCNTDRNTFQLDSPDGNVNVSVRLGEDSSLIYRVSYDGEPVVVDSRLGLVLEDADLSSGFRLDSVGPVAPVYDEYKMTVGKRSDYTYVANSRTFHLSVNEGAGLDIIFNVSNDGVAFRYRLNGKEGERKKIMVEASSFSFLPGTKAYIQKLATPQTGWSNTQPSYEEHYETGVPVEELPENVKQWIYPALFNSGNLWVLLTEAGVDDHYCGSRIAQGEQKNQFTVAFPDERESFTGGGALPEGSLPWETPWRIIVLGDHPGAIVESTLGTDLALPPAREDIDFVKPGKASWSWVLKKDDSIVYDVQKRFVDYAAEMGWQYCLVDVNWNRKIGYDRIAELSAYAHSKDIGLILWYNSSGDWNTTVYEPKSALLTHEDRVKEFEKLRDMGIKGIKVDFFGGDARSMIGYYHDIFMDAADFGLMVNCHGCTLPRGWQRTYPNLVTMESVRGMEFVTFEQFNADLQPSHCCMLPFTRNVFDPMDFTPVCFSEVPGIKRRTSNGFELALSVIFWSGVQHVAEIPEGMAAVPGYVRDFMSTVPAVWDDVKFIDGVPGSYVLIARRKGNTWYIGGINGEDQPRTFRFKPGCLPESSAGILIRDGDSNRSFAMDKVTCVPEEDLEVEVMPYGGFVLQILGH